MRWLGILLNVFAVFALAGSPLATFAVVVALTNGAAALASAWVAGGSAARAVTALQHLTTGLAGFFLFVWLAL